MVFFTGCMLAPKNTIGIKEMLMESPSREGTSLVRSPGFEPGSSAWQADVLAKLDYDRSDFHLIVHYLRDLGQ